MPTSERVESEPTSGRQGLSARVGVAPGGRAEPQLCDGLAREDVKSAPIFRHRENRPKSEDVEPIVPTALNQIAVSREGLS